MGVGNVVMFEFSEVVAPYILIGSLWIFHGIIDIVILLVIKMVVSLCGERPLVNVQHRLGFRVETEEINIISQS